MSAAQAVNAAVNATLRGVRQSAPPPGPWDMKIPMGSRLTDTQTRTAAWVLLQVASGKRLVTYSAPTGTGKSVLNLAAASRIGPCAYITPQNVLVNQLRDDKFTGPNVAVVMGSGHYQCPEFGSCDLGRSGRGKGEWEGERENTKNPGRCSRAGTSSCGYTAALSRASASTCAVTNLHYYFFSGSLNRQDRPILVCDEAQDLEEVMAGLFRITVGGPRDHAAQAAGFDTLPKTEEALAVWWPSYAAEMESERTRLKSRLEEALDSIHRLGDDGLRGGLARDLKKSLFAIERRISNASVMEEETEKQGLKWCVDFRPARDGQVRAVLSPVTVQRFCRRYLLGDGKNGDGRVAVVSSATPPSRLDLDATEDEYARLDVPDGFPPANRPVFGWPVASTARRNRESGLVRVAEAIDLLARTRYAGTKGLIHCHAKSVMGELARLLHTPHMSQRDGSREASLEEWRKSTVPIFLSVAMEQGVDLPGTDCRWQVLPVVPFPDLSDKRVQLRKSLPDGGEWFLRRTANAVIQASGRNCRSADDWGHTYIMAKEWRMVYNAKTTHLYPGWWHDAYHTLPESWRPS